MNTETELLVETPVVASHNNYLAEQTTQIRSRAIPWEVFPFFFLYHLCKDILYDSMGWMLLGG